MVHQTAGHGAILGIHAPAPGRSFHQQRPRPGSGMAQGRLISGQRLTIGGGGKAMCLGPMAGQPVVRRNAIVPHHRQPQFRPARRQRSIGENLGHGREDHAHLPPVGAQFQRRDLRQLGADPLPHLQLRHADGDHTIAPHPDPGVEGHLALARRQRQRVRSLTQPPRHHQPAAKGRAHQQLAARQLHGQACALSQAAS